MKWTLVLLPFLLQTAHAVSVDDCPSRIHVELGRMTVTQSEDNVLGELDQSGIEDEKKDAVKGLMAQLPQATYTMDFSYERGASGRCTYKNMNVTGTQEKAVLYTQGGKNILKVQTTAAALGILVRAYITVQEVTTDGLYLAETDPGLAIAVPRSLYKNYSAGGPLVFVGKVKDLTVDVP